MLETTAKEFGSKSSREIVSIKLGELIRKFWNPVNFKGHVNPIEFIEAVSVASNGKFKCDIKSNEAKFGGQADPAQFLGWCLSTLTYKKLFEKNF